MQAVGVKRKRTWTPLRLTDAIGRWTLRQYNRYVDLFVLVLQSIPRLVSNLHRRSVRQILWRQLLFTFTDAVPVTIRVSVSVGLLLLVQTAMWSESMGSSSQITWPLIIRVMIRDLAPMLASMIVVGRSASAIATELSIMKVTGQIEVIESHGIDPMSYVVMPRIIAPMVSVPLLGCVILVVTFTSGYLVGLAMNVMRLSPSGFLDQIAESVQLYDAWFFFPKTIVTGAFIGAICSFEGLSVKSSLTESPLVASRAGVRSMTAVFIISAILSFLVYGRVLVFRLF